MVNKYGSIGANDYGTKPIVAHVEPFYGADRQYGDHTANARLIAAAPILLSIVRRFVALPSEAELMQDARAAVAAATLAADPGQEPKL